MNLETLFVREKKEFDELKELVSDMLFSDDNLPQQVFREQFSHYLFEEFDWAMSDEFWDTIQKLAEQAKDDFILTAVLNPHPVNYYYKEFGYFNWTKLPINLSADDYFNVLELGPNESPADAILFNSDTVVWLSPSGKWAIWGERAYGICVLALKEPTNTINSSLFLKTWRSIDNEAVMNWVGLNFKGRKVPKEVTDALYMNYSNKI